MSSARPFSVVRVSRARVALGAIATAWLLWTLLAWFHAVVVSHSARTAAHASAAWGALLLASFTGWGSALGATLFPRVRADWGLRCAWGWGVAVAVGGVLCALGLARRPALLGFTAIGLALFAVDVSRAYARWARRGTSPRVRSVVRAAAFPAAAAALFLLGVVRAAASIVDYAFNPNDDGVAYFAFAREILERGTLTQPFSLRRVSAYGGKSLLDAMQLAIDVPEKHLHLLDDGLAMLTVLALLAGHARSVRRAGRVVLLLAMLLVVTLPGIGINSTTLMTGVVFFLGLYRTLVWPPIARARSWRAAALVALLAAGACTLRQSYLVPVATLLVLAYGEPIVRRLRVASSIDRAALRDAAMTAGLLAALLAPWAALSYRWTGSLLFPAMKGNYDAAYPIFPRAGAIDWGHYLAANLGYCQPIASLPLFVLAAVVSADRRRRKPLRATVVAAVVGFGALLFGYANGAPSDQARYYFGFTCAAVLAVTLAAAEEAGRRRAPGERRLARLASVALVLVAVALQLFWNRARSLDAYDLYATRLEAALAASTPWVPSRQAPAYRALQDVVPPGEPIAVLVDEPSHFNHARNRIASLDMVGAVSPPPGIPLAAGPEAVAAYLQSVGYRYLVVVAPNAAIQLYRRDVWRAQQVHSAPVWQQSAHFYLEAFDDLDGLRATRAHLADAQGMTTLDLAARAP